VTRTNQVTIMIVGGNPGVMGSLSGGGLWVDIVEGNELEEVLLPGKRSQKVKNSKVYNSNILKKEKKSALSIEMRSDRLRVDGRKAIT